MADEKITEAIKKLREQNKKRAFSQTVDLIVNLKNIDTKKSGNKINETFVLPNAFGKGSEVVVFSDTIKADNFKVLKGADIQKMTKDKRSAKKLARSTSFFLSEPKLMPLIGKNLGQILAPRGKMPTLISGDVNVMVNRLKKSIRIRIKDSPVIQCAIGEESMDDEKLAQNVEAVVTFLQKRLPKGRDNIKNVMIKMTMSKPVKIEA